MDWFGLRKWIRIPNLCLELFFIRNKLYLNSINKYNFRNFFLEKIQTIIMIKKSIRIIETEFINSTTYTNYQGTRVCNIKLVNTQTQ